MSKSLIVIITLLLIALLSFGKYVSVRNTLVSKNEAVKSAWSQVDVVLQRRADLIPNLVETVKGITKQEQTVFGEIAQARSQLLSASTPADKIAANQHLDGALGRLLAIAENYPQLKSNENFLRFQDELPARKTASPWSASVITTLSRITTLTFSNFPTTSLRSGLGSSQITRTLPRPRARAKCRK